MIAHTYAETASLHHMINPCQKEPFSTGAFGRRLTASIDIPQRSKMIASKETRKPRGLSWGKWMKQRVSDAFSSLGNSNSSQASSNSAVFSSPAIKPSPAGAINVRKHISTNARYYNASAYSNSGGSSNCVKQNNDSSTYRGSRGNTIKCANCRKYYRVFLSKFEDYCCLDCKSAHQLRRIQGGVESSYHQGSGENNYNAY